MKCRYREKRITSGMREEIFIYPEFAKVKKGKRAPKYKATSETQQRLNNKNAVRKLARSINCNFGKNDLLLSIGYQDWNRPDTLEQVQKDVQDFIRRLRYHYKKISKILKYIIVFEEGELRGNFHVHIFLSQGLDRDKIENLWGRGCANCKRLQPDFFKGLDRVAGYVSKSPLGSKRWIPSKNLVKPKERVRTVSRRKALEFLEALQSSETAHKVLDGAELLGIDELDNEVNGCLYAVVDILHTEKTEEGKKCRKKE